DVAAYNEEIRNRLQRVGLDGQADSFLVGVPDVKNILAARRESILGEIRNFETGGQGSTVPSLSELDRQTTAIKGRLQLSETKRKAFEKYQTERQALVGAIHALREEIAEIQGSVKESLAANVKERLERYLDIFDVLQEERRTLEDLYDPLREVLQSGGDVGRKLTFWSKINAELNAHTQRCLTELLDRTRRGRYREENALGLAVGELWRRIEESEFQREAIRTAVSEFYESFLSDADGSEVRVADQLRVRKAERDFDDWFFSTDLYSVSYSIKFDNKDLLLLSPGQKGIVLLLLYLEIEQEDRRPLIIDQPEENLDNVSIYDNLVEYFRKCKKNRQIIMITHNPNLVVNADAEQVIVADFDGARTPKIAYHSGALENTVLPDGSRGIREHVCRILEGGAEAFRRREKKYWLPPA
ncbi:MAG: AAA family ATPase, partial [Acidobacteria bacterium]|nr:AAA family ATPase [Acidobacteriota bacterium]